MKTKTLVATLITVASLIASSSFAQGKLNVMTTTEDLASIAREVGGDRITVDSIAKGYQDAHFVEAKPSFRRRTCSSPSAVSSKSGGCRR